MYGAGFIWVSLAVIAFMFVLAVLLIYAVFSIAAPKSSLSASSPLKADEAYSEEISTGQEKQTASEEKPTKPSNVFALSVVSAVLLLAIWPINYNYVYSANSNEAALESLALAVLELCLVWLLIRLFKRSTDHPPTH